MLGDSLRRRHAPRHTPEADDRGPAPRRESHRRLAWWHWLLLALGVLGGSFGIGYLLATYLLFPAPETAGAAIAVPDLYDQRGSDAERALRDLGLDVAEPTALTSSDVPEGRVLAQAPVPGQQLRPGAQVQLVVSAGPPTPIVPAVTGFRQESGRELLEAVGFEVDVQQVRSRLPAGTVTGTDPEAGLRVRLPARVSLVVSAGPPESEVEEGVERDTIGGMVGAGAPPDGEPEWR